MTHLKRLRIKTVKQLLKRFPYSTEHNLQILVLVNQQEKLVTEYGLINTERVM